MWNMHFLRKQKKFTKQALESEGFILTFATEQLNKLEPLTLHLD